MKYSRGLFSFFTFLRIHANPDANMENLAVIKFARINNIPFLGTCSGYQHAVLEYVINILGFCEADNAKGNPETEIQLISALFCKIYSNSRHVHTFNKRIYTVC